MGLPAWSVFWWHRQNKIQVQSAAERNQRVNSSLRWVPLRIRTQGRISHVVLFRPEFAFNKFERGQWRGQRATAIHLPFVRHLSGFLPYSQGLFTFRYRDGIDTAFAVYTGDRIAIPSQRSSAVLLISLSVARTGWRGEGKRTNDPSSSHLESLNAAAVVPRSRSSESCMSVL